jgi:hypothetical protein
MLQYTLKCFCEEAISIWTGIKSSKQTIPVYYLNQESGHRLAIAFLDDCRFAVKF